MPNHFHILIREKIEGGISKYMLKLMTGYSMYFNKRYERTGKLYEGVFKSSLLDKDTYLKYIYSYIHLNPAKLQDKNWRENKKSIPGKHLKLITRGNFPLYFKNPENIKKNFWNGLILRLNKIHRQRLC